MRRRRSPLARRVAAAALAGGGWIALVLAAGGQAGHWSATLDVLNSFAPIAAALAIGGLAGVPLLSEARARRLALLVAASALPAALLRILPELARTVPAAARPIAGSPADRVTIVSHNVGVENRAPRATLRVLRASGADILFLQETDGTVGRHLGELRETHPYATRCPAGDCSLAILSRWPIATARYTVRDARGRVIGPPLLRTRVGPPGRKAFNVVTIHLPWPVPAARQARLRAALARSIRRLDQSRLIVAGDFNLTPWSFAMPRLDRGMRPLTRVTQALASFPARVPSGRLFPVALLPIDHVYAGPGWATVSVERLSRTGSDHYPVRVRLERR